MYSKGNLVLYKNQPALVKACAEKITIEYCSKMATKTGKAAQFSTQKVREKDIYLLHNGPTEELPLTICKEGEKETSLPEDFLDRLKEAWSLFLEENTETFSLHDIADFTTDEWTPSTSWALYKNLIDSPYFEITTSKETNKILFSLHNEKDAQYLQEKKEAKGKEEELYKEFLNRLKEKNLHLPEDGRFMGEVEALALGKTEKSKVMKKISIAQSPEKAHKLLIETGIWPYWRNPHPARLGLSKQSANEHLCHPPKEDRIIMTHTAWAIDAESSADPDDAIAFFDGFLWVHIADPASTVMPDSSIDKAARDRGSTLYLPEGAARMLAEESLEDYALGLREKHQDSFKTDEVESYYSRALTFKISLSDTAEVLDCEVLKTFVKVERLSYKTADEKKDSPELAPLYEIAKKNILKRTENGSVSINLPEAHLFVHLPEGGSTEAEPEIHIEEYDHYESNDVVREAMLLAGEGSANFAFKNGIPFPFVSQEEPDIPKNIPEGLAGEYKKRRCMHRRSVGITPSKHAALGLYKYSQVTSPLRRYGDLIAHEQLRAFIDKRDVLDKDTLLERISAGDAAGRSTVKAERNSSLHWKLVYLKQRPEWTGKAFIAEIRDKEATILIPSLAFERRIAFCDGMTLNQEITVKAIDINIPELSVSFIQA